MPDPASQHNETGRTHGMPFIFWLLEQNGLLLLAAPTIVAALAFALSGFGLTLAGAVTFGLTWLAVPLFGVVLPLMYLVYRSHRADSSVADWSAYFSFKDEGLGKQYAGKKIPMEIFYEAYMAEKVDFKQDVYEVMLRRNQLFQFCFTWGDVKFYFREFLGQNVTHSQASDKGDIAHVYDRGNDFYNWFLGESMTYTSGIFRDPEESLEVAQERKLETVCQYVQMKPGDKHLDIGCGWGPMITYAAQHYGTHSTGITLAKEQAAWATERAAKAGVSDKVRIIVDDYRNLPSEKFDKITCLEMAEHVGIKNFQKFLLQVRSMLKDDGIFYLQIGGAAKVVAVRRSGVGPVHGQIHFPGADASCPARLRHFTSGARGLRGAPGGELRRSLQRDDPQVVRELEEERSRYCREIRPEVVPDVDDVPVLVGDHRRAGQLDGVHGHDEQEHQERQIDGVAGGGQTSGLQPPRSLDRSEPGRYAAVSTSEV